jgi:hypothetical protein
MTDGTNVFDPTLFPQYDAVRDRRPIRPQIERTYYPEGAFAQGADVNEGFSIEVDKRKAIGNLIASDGDRLSGGDIVVNVGASTVFISDGEVYAQGGRRSIAAKTLTAVPMTGAVTLGFRRVETIVTSDDDAIYLGLVAAAVESYGEPGAIRTIWTFSWAFDTDGGTGDFFAYVHMKDGVVVAQSAPPTLSGVQQQIAVYDYDAHENYVVRGCNVSALGKTGSSQVFSIAEGVANIMGFKATRNSANLFNQVENPDLGTVSSEPSTFADGGTGTAVITTRRFPIAAVNSAIVTKQRTVTITKGVNGSVDALPDSGVTTILSVVQGGTTYTVPTSYSQVGDAVDWTSGGAQPTTGSSYQVTYQYLVAVTPTAVTPTTITLTGGVTGSTVLLIYTYKLPRIDKIGLDQDGNVVYLTGVSAQTRPQPPQVPTVILSLATITNDWLNTPTVKNDGIRAYPFPLIDRMYNKLLNLLNEVTLQKQSLDINVRSAGNANGVFSDPLTSDVFRDAGYGQNGAVFNGSFQIPIAPTFQPISVSGPLMLDFQQETVISQTLISGCAQINPYMSFSPLPAIMTITPAEDYWTQQQTVWLSEQTQVFGSGNTERVVDTTVLSSVASAPIRYLRQITVGFTISKFGPGETLTKLIFADHDVTPAGLVANGSGIITGSFVIPANVPSGSKLVVATGGSGAVCAATFTGQGMLEITELQTVTSVQRYQVNPPARIAVAPVKASSDPAAPPSFVYRRGGPDPQAQSFVLVDGRHISSVDIKFCAIGDVTKPVIVEFVTMENGFPTPVVIAQAEVNMATVFLNQWTTFVFPVPFYLPENQFFAFVVKTNDPTHAISVADRGQFDAINQKWIASQPYTVGTRFSSSNAETWTVHQDSDITFRLNCAVFNPVSKTVALGVFAVTNCSDLIMRGDIFLPTDATSVAFDVTFGSEPTVRVLPDQVLERTSFFTGNVTIKAILSGSTTLSPVVGKDLLAIFGTMQANGVYVSDAWAMGTAIKLDAVMSLKLPVGSSLLVEADPTTNVWTTLPQIAAIAIDGGYTETTFEKTPYTAPLGRLRLTLTGTPAARPTVADLRAWTI